MKIWKKKSVLQHKTEPFQKHSSIFQGHFLKGQKFDS